MKVFGEIRLCSPITFCVSSRRPRSPALSPAHYSTARANKDLMPGPQYYRARARHFGKNGAPRLDTISAAQFQLPIGKTSRNQTSVCKMDGNTNALLLFWNWATRNSICGPVMNLGRTSARCEIFIGSTIRAHAQRAQHAAKHHKLRGDHRAEIRDKANYYLAQVCLLFTQPIAHYARLISRTPCETDNNKFHVVSVYGKHIGS